MTFQYTLNTSLKKIDVTANSKPYFPFLTTFFKKNRIFSNISEHWGKVITAAINPTTEKESSSHSDIAKVTLVVDDQSWRNYESPDHTAQKEDQKKIMSWMECILWDL